MLQNGTIVEFLEARLNAMGEKVNITFKLYADAAIGDRKATVLGSLRVVGDDNTPIENFTARTYKYALSFSVKDHLLGEKIAVFNRIVADVISELNGKSFMLDNGEAVFNFDIPQTGDIKMEGSAYASNVPSRLNFSVLYTLNAVTTAKKVWMLDDKIIPYLEESVDLEIEGSTNPIYGAHTAKSLTNKQTKFYKFRLPYDDSDLCRMLQADILKSEIDKTYKLKYYDGIAFTEDNPFETCVALFRTVGNQATRPSVSTFTVVFTDADDGADGSIIYEMALIDNPFDSGSVNVRWFENTESQRAWYDEKIQNGAPYARIKAPNLNSLTITQQVYIKPQNCNLGLNDLLTKNYAIIKVTGQNKSDALYYYYYVVSASVGAYNQILVNLQMDTVQTYYFNESLEIPPCLIERAHLNRWVDNGDGLGVFSFDNRPNSQMLISEGENLPKYLTSREELQFCISSHGDSEYVNDTLDELNRFFKKYKPNFVICFMKQSEELFGYKDNLFKIKGIDTGMYVLVAPIFRSDEYSAKLTVTVLGKDYEFDIENLMRFIEKHASEVISIKITPICPFHVDVYIKGDYTIENNNLNIKDINKFGLKLNVETGDNVLFLKSPSRRPAFAYCQNIKTEYGVNDIKNANNDFELNPKSLSPNIKEYRIVDYMGNSFSYDLQKLNNIYPVKILVTETLTPDLTKGYVRLESVLESCYTEGSDENYTGLVYSNDTSLPISINKLDEFLANNKNYALMQQASRNYNEEIYQINRNNNAQQLGLNMLMNTYNGLASQSPGFLADNAYLMGSFYFSDKATKSRLEAQNSLARLNETLTLDNMRCAPEDLKNAQGNIFLCMSIKKTGLVCFHIEEYSATNADCEKMHNYYTQFGFAFNQLGNIREYDHIRHYFNYIQADIDAIYGVSMSNDARNDLRRRFSQGIRFWNSDEIQYEWENYENWLEEVGS